MSLLSAVGTSFGCSASGERLVSAARDGDLQEAKALLECNPRLARYFTFGVRNSPLHYSAAHGHHEIVYLLLESGVDINARNTRGQTALMQACQYGHWEVVQILMLFKANIHKADQLNAGTALHFAAISGHTRCIRLLLADYVPSIPHFWNIMRRSSHGSYNVDFDESALSRIVNRRADGGITALHMAALHGHFETVQLLLDLGACVSLVTVEDGTTIDLIGAGSSPLHYAACGGNVQCCQQLISRGASLTAKNANGWTPLMVALSWNRNWLEGVLSRKPEGHLHVHPSPYLALPLMSIMNIARECGLRFTDQSPAFLDPCAVCLERKCTVAAEGCGHEFCTRCALYLCSMSNTYAIVSGTPGSIACPLCRHAVMSFVKLSSASPAQGLRKTSMSMALCATGATTCPRRPSPKTVSQVCMADLSDCIPPLRSSSFRSSCQKFSSMKFPGVLCMGVSETCSSILRCSGSRLRRSMSDTDSRSSRLLPLNQQVATVRS